MPNNAGAAAGGADGGLTVELLNQVRQFKQTIGRGLSANDQKAHQALRALCELAIQGGASRFDGLTHLPNLTGLAVVYERLLNEITSPRSDRRNAADAIVVLSFDLVDFKRHNDELTWVGGNRVLIAFAQILTSSLRHIDVAARQGGDEFFVCCPVNTQMLGMDATEFARMLSARITRSCDRYNARPDRVATIEFRAKWTVVTRQDPKGLLSVLEELDPKRKYKP